jgi:hypothetical protein
MGHNLAREYPRLQLFTPTSYTFINNFAFSELAHPPILAQTMRNTARFDFTSLFWKDDGQRDLHTKNERVLV